MKTHLFYAIAAGILMVSFSACQKNEIEDGDEKTLTNVQEPGQSAEGITTFTASLEIPQASAASTKMTLEDGEGNQKVPSWEAGDKIKIFYVDPSTSQMTSVEGTADAAGRETTFSVTVPAGVENFWAVYPATLESSVDADGNFSVPTRVGDSDETTFANACISIAKCGSDKSFRFKNICSVLKFTVAERGNVMKLLSLNATPVTGTVHASLDANNDVVYAAEPYTSTNYTRVFKALPSGATNTVCYMPVLVGTQAAGIAIDCKGETSKPAVFAQISLPFERSHIYNLGEVDGKMVTDYYITATGSGTKDGKSIENAGDVETFKSLVGIVAGDPSEDSSVKCARYAQIWKLKGTTFHFGAGTYVFGDATNERLTIDFNGASGSLYAPFTIQGADLDVEGNPTTIFSGNGTYGILNVFDRARVHINKVSFTRANNTVATADDTDIHSTNIGAALYMKQKTTGAKAAPRVWLTDCVFENNQTNHSASTHIYEGGSCINLVGGAVYADHCIFRNNKENKRNGCVKLSGGNNYSDLAYAFFNACLFTGNEVETVTSGQGSTMLRNYRKGGLLGMYNCTFYNNGTDSNNKRNGITLDRSAIIANCTIVDEFTDNGTSNRADPIRLRADEATTAGPGYKQFILANNLIINKASGPSIRFIGTKRTDLRLYMEGGNLFGSAEGGFYTNVTNTIKTDANEYSGYSYTDIDSPSFADNVFKWAGTLGGGATVCNFMSHDAMVDNVLKSSHINRDGDTAFSITDNEGAEKFAGFYTWLNSIGAIDVDAMGNPRPATGWTPGAYQAQ